MSNNNVPGDFEEGFTLMIALLLLLVLALGGVTFLKLHANASSNATKDDHSLLVASEDSHQWWAIRHGYHLEWPAEYALLSIKNEGGGGARSGHRVAYTYTAPTDAKKVEIDIKKVVSEQKGTLHLNQDGSIAFAEADGLALFFTSTLGQLKVEAS